MWVLGSSRFITRLLLAIVVVMGYVKKGSKTFRLKSVFIYFFNKNNFFDEF